MFVKDLMNRKVYYLKENQTISIADILKLELKKVLNIPIVNNEFKLVGLISQKELLWTLAGKADNVQVKKIMINDIITISPNTPLKGAVDIMIANKCGCLPVIDKDSKLVGLLTEYDLLKEFFEMLDLPEHRPSELRVAAL